MPGLSSFEKRWLCAVLDAIIPPGPEGPLAACASEARALELFEDMARHLPSGSGLGLRASVWFMEWAAPLFGLGKPVRFSALSAEDREECLSRLAAHRTYFARQMLLLHKANACLAWAADEKVWEGLGLHAPPRFVKRENQKPDRLNPRERFKEQTFDRVPGRGLLRDAADFVVIGTGPAGATAAHVLSSRGFDVLMIEEGRWAEPEDATGTAYHAQKHFYRGLGASAAMGKSVIPVIQGRCVGGGSVINAAIIWRLPEDVFDRWNEEHGIERAVTFQELNRCFEILERDLHVRPVAEEVLGRNNALLKLGADRLGIESRIIPRNERGCQGHAQCLTVCPVQAKQSADLTYIPAALSKGARLYSSCRAFHIDVERGRARRAHAEFRDPLSGQFRGRLVAEARKGVVVAASAVQTPLLLMRSGIGMSSGHLGRHFMGHPGASIVGIYPEEVRIWEGATQGWDSEHFRKTGKVKFEALSIPPDLLCVRVPGAGRGFKESLMDYARLGNVGCAVIAEAEGKVVPLGDDSLIFYSMTPKDAARLGEGLYQLARIMFEAGAEAVLPGIHGLPSRIEKDRLHLLKDPPHDPRAYTTVMTHLFSTARLGEDPGQSVVGFDFQVHDTKGVYVVDSSVFPSNIGVNPQHSIMALAMAAAEKIAAGA